MSSLFPSIILQGANLIISVDVFILELFLWLSDWTPIICKVRVSCITVVFHPSIWIILLGIFIICIALTFVILIAILLKIATLRLVVIRRPISIIIIVADRKKGGIQARYMGQPSPMIHHTTGRDRRRVVNDSHRLEQRNIISLFSFFTSFRIFLHLHIQRASMQPERKTTLGGKTPGGAKMILITITLS